jgi:hypothetical protein
MTTAYSRLHVIMKNHPTFISGSTFPSLAVILIPDKMNGYVHSGAPWPNSVTVRPSWIILGYAMEAITSN